MTGRKVLKRKRHCLEISKARWSIPSKKDFVCQVEISFKQPAHVQTIATQTDPVLPAPSSEVSGVKQDGELALHADKVLCQFYQLSVKCKKLQNVAALLKRLLKIEQFIK